MIHKVFRYRREAIHVLLIIVIGISLIHDGKTADWAFWMLAIACEVK